MCSVDLAGPHHHDYGPRDLEIGGGEEVQLDYCLDCGRIHCRRDYRDPQGSCKGRFRIRAIPLYIDQGELGPRGEKTIVAVIEPIGVMPKPQKKDSMRVFV
jgi:hypothetical protein